MFRSETNVHSRLKEKNIQRIRFYPHATEPAEYGHILDGQIRLFTHCSNLMDFLILILNPHYVYGQNRLLMCVRLSDECKHVSGSYPL